MAKNVLRLKIWGLCALFALLISIPFLIPHCSITALFAFVPLFYMERLCTEHSVKHTWWYYFTAFLLFNIAATFWVWFVSEVGAVAALTLNTLQMAAIFALFRWSKKRLKSEWLPYLFFIVLWLAWEHIYFEIELSWPWLVLGNAFATSTKLIQWYEVLGSLGGSLWALLTSVLTYFLLIRFKGRNVGEKRPIRALALTLSLLVVVPIAASLTRYYTYKEIGNPLEVVVVQPNVDPFQKYGIIPQESLDIELLNLIATQITPQTKYIVTPETFTYNLNLDNPESNPSYNRYLEFLSDYPQVNMLLGTLSNKFYFTSGKPTKTARDAKNYWYDVYNTALLFDSGSTYNYYHKSKLVPGVEIIPYQNTLPFLGDFIAKFGGSNSSYGVQDDISILSGNDGNKVGAMICYESVYGDYSRKAAKLGATFMAVMTNDGWWGDTPGYRQHFRYAALRSIETRRDVVHAANTGISGFINQRGDVIQRTAWWVPAAIKGEVNVNSEITPFTKYGDVIGTIAAYLSIPFLLVVVFGALVRRRRSGKVR